MPRSQSDGISTFQHNWREPPTQKYGAWAQDLAFRNGYTHGFADAVAGLEYDQLRELNDCCFARWLTTGLVSALEWVEDNTWRKVSDWADRRLI
jgi:hypothetical protein